MLQTMARWPLSGPQPDEDSEVSVSDPVIADPPPGTPGQCTNSPAPRWQPPPSSPSVRVVFPQQDGRVLNILLSPRSAPHRTVKSVSQDVDFGRKKRDANLTDRQMGQPPASPPFPGETRKEVGALKLREERGQREMSLWSGFQSGGFSAYGGGEGIVCQACLQRGDTEGREF